MIMSKKIRRILVIFLAAAFAAGCSGGSLDKTGPEESVDPSEQPETPAEDERPDPAEALESLREGDILPAWQEGCLDIHSINGGRGEAFYYIMPDGTTMLVDAAGGADYEIDGAEGSGIYSKPSQAYSSGNVIVRYIQHFAPECAEGKIDYMMISHFHGDHMGSFSTSFSKYGWKAVDRLGQQASSVDLDNGGFLLNGLPEVGMSLPITKLIDRGDWDQPPSNVWTSAPKRRQNYYNFVDWSQRTHNTVRESLAVGHTDQITLLHKPQDYPSFSVRGIAGGGYVWTGSGTSSSTSLPSAAELLANLDTWDPNENIFSCVFTLSYGDFDWFSGGDIQYNGRGTYAWKDIEAPISKVVGKVEAMKANHHCTKNTNGSTLLAALRPDVFVAGVWTENHPNPDTVKRLYAASPSVTFFATNMAASCITTLQDAGVDTGKFASLEGHVVIRVMPGGKSYYVIVLNDGNFDYDVRSVHGPFACS